MPELDARQELSKTYFGACSRMQEACDALYEALHTSSGQPDTCVESVYDSISEYRRWLLIEADLIREAVKQYNEAQ